MINATLHASYPPSLPGHICDWNVTSATGEPPDSLECSQWLESLPSRIETVSVLNHLVFQHIIKALIIVWMVGLWCRLTRSLAAYQQDVNESNVRFMLDTGVALLVCLLAMNERLKSFVAVVAYWAVMCGGWVDALAMVLVFALAFNKCMLAGICLSFAYNSWAFLQSRIPWTNSELPNFGEFFSGLRPVEERGRRQGSCDEVKEDECLICWSSDDGLPLRLPCRPDHLVCTDCIIRLYGSGQNQCPLCRLPLFTLFTIKEGAAELCGFITACFGANLPIGPIFIALNCYKAWWYWTMVAIFLAVPVMLMTWYLFKLPHGVNMDDLDNWVVETFGGGHAHFALLFAC